ncbi:Uncharacterized membrane protein YckC, RDD family [Singulisphaera sp. GP187]|uniref:RDD family protein n=1 Tax=Singulisphaera sp. GP187 TaxID=1882752 RepID=UPI00092B32D8|nr:RDD family protein [Singulisphaera sp. GP187]SIO44819.1 Uncharacterized membrane protein YckC, RDD family [Singulisphaera sp. GP187]
MSFDNPYAAPEADLTVIKEVESDGELATRSTRLGAAIVDSLIGIVYAMPITYLLGTWNYISQGLTPPIGLSLTATALGFLAFLLIHGSFLKANGQTIGKKLAGIRIADLNGNVPDLGTLILRRYLPISIVASIPLLGAYLPIGDVLFIFRKDRRCVHDLIAGTKVVLNQKQR